MKKPALFFVSALLVSCGGSSGLFSPTSPPKSSPDRSVVLVEESIPTTVPVSVVEQPVSTIDQSQPEFTPSTNFSTGDFRHACGTYNFVQEDLRLSLLRDVNGHQESVEGASYELPTPAELADHWLTDVTGDAQPEVILVWYPEWSSHTYGHVLTASAPECGWHYASIISGCSGQEMVPDLFLKDDGGLTEFDFLACGGGSRDENRLVWNEEFSVFVAEPLPGRVFCDSYSDWYQLPIGVCHGGWAVSMGQEFLAAAGFDVVADGRFGPGTRLATLAYQRSLGLNLTGSFDEATWASMFPAGGPNGDNWTEFPDFDGDGVSSPGEIGHASGAIE